MLHRPPSRPRFARSIFRRSRAASVPTPGPTLATAGILVAGAAAALLRERRAARRFERLGGAALETLLNAIDANDPVTGAHLRRVARYALVLASARELDDHTCHAVERVALFHDIGKLDEALFDVIHDAHGLTPEERQTIRTHPQRGADVVAPLAAFYPDLPEGIVSHHERWDGTGYPRQLAGTAIPLTARIVAIADTFDAITHTRRYHEGRSTDTARDAIREGRSTQFDPDLVDLFLSPAVAARIDDAMRATRFEGKDRATRRSRAGKAPAPDVSFRWRGTAPEPPAPDPAPPAPR